MDGGTVEISIMNPGLYAFGPKSSTGKSYLYNLLRTWQIEGVFCIRYDVATDLDYIISRLNKFKCSDIPILFIDRFDTVLCDEVANRFKSMKNKYVLLDFKDNFHSNLLRAKPANLYRLDNVFKIDA